jgi:hypothetical protein
MTQPNKLDQSKIDRDARWLKHRKKNFAVCITPAGEFDNIHGQPSFELRFTTNGNVSYGINFLPEELDEIRFAIASFLIEHETQTGNEVTKSELLFNPFETLDIST